MDGNAAHRDRLAGILAAFGQRDVEARRGDLRIVEEQLEEIAHAVEEQSIASLVLQAPVLDHHGGWGIGAGHPPVPTLVRRSRESGNPNNLGSGFRGSEELD